MSEDKVAFLRHSVVSAGVVASVRIFATHSQLSLLKYIIL